MSHHHLDEVLKRAQSRLALIADLSEAMAGTLDAREGLERVCRLLAQRLGDWCAIDLLQRDDRIERVCASSRATGPENCEPRAWRLCPPQDATGALADALRGGNPALLHAHELRALSRASEWESTLAEELARHGATTAIVAPLRARRDVLGVLCVARCGDHRHLSKAELTLIEGLAHRVGLALDNARLYAEAEHIAERLQRSLLPDLPQLPGLTMAARYVPSGAAAQVGGDWYDVFALPGGPSALIVGDVVGHDLRAAIAMSQIRNMLRGIACDREEPPEAIVRRLDTATGALCPGTCATCVYAVLHDDSEDRAWSLDYTAAGHPPPLLIMADGDSRYLEAGHGPLLGVDPSLPRTSATEAVTDGATILLYSDGLIERRGESLDHGFTRLRRHAATLAAETPDTLCDQLLSALAPESDDDVVLLAVRPT
jgi:serine phosphatase RsbU (regulator of sigma subunit)